MFNENRMRVIVGRIVTRHLQWFKDNFKETPHIVHDHILQSTRKPYQLGRLKRGSIFNTGCDWDLRKAAEVCSGC
ncbi:hypothetical protein DPMN_159993 [Dreissena polymorpha]|uniref:Uncharacterized protein n=1 Tax=Dreissena polymorpha TaxID=45954 RepID=A0A9D4EKP3_DREPO|nr:hypothetical protein DPMN_159993 [Dreissena polymorpha]